MEERTLLAELDELEKTDAAEPYSLAAIDAASQYVPDVTEMHQHANLAQCLRDALYEARIAAAARCVRRWTSVRSQPGEAAMELFMKVRNEIDEARFDAALQRVEARARERAERHSVVYRDLVQKYAEEASR